YSFGCLVYEALTGRLPFVGPVVGIVSQHLHAAPAPPSRHEPDLPSGIDPWVLRLLAKRPADRPESARPALAEPEAIRARLDEGERAIPALPVGAQESAAPPREASDSRTPPSLRRTSAVSPPGERPLVGRQRELGALVEALDEAAAGHGQLFFVTGE